jgi:alkaline phosphatase D
MTPSVTSSNLFETLSAQLGGSNQLLSDGLTAAAVRLNNPHIQYFNGSQYGYSTLELRRDRCDWTAYSVSKELAAEATAPSVVMRQRKYTWWPRLVTP